MSIDVEKNLFHCNDHDRGGTVIDWEVLQKKITPAEAMRQLGGGPNGTNSPPTKPQIVARYNYVDETGELLFQCVRYMPKDFRQRRPDGNGDWIWDLKGTRRVLYRLPEIPASFSKAATYIARLLLESRLIWRR